MPVASADSTAPRPSLGRLGRIPIPDQRPRQAENLWAANSYLGEVVRRAQPHARWHVGSVDDPSTWRIEMEHVFLAFNPVGMAREAITMEEEEGWNAHLEVLAQDRDVLKQSLERVGAVEDEDYWRLAVRWEGVDQALAVLESAAQARGESARRWTPDIYAAALDEREPSPSPS